MSSKELSLVEPDILTPEEKTELNADIDRIIEAHKANRKEINRLVFESVAAMTEADEAGAELANKGWFARKIGDWTGSNQKLQDKINSSHAAAQYASQLTLQKLAEQNLMSFDLLTAVNNKLNASMQHVGEEFNRIYTGLGKFFQYNQNQLVKMELRMEKVERNVKLLTWQNSIEYLDYEGESYTDMDPAGKIACVVRDFYDITGGEWSTTDLLLLKAAMSAIDLSPKMQVNYGTILEEITESAPLHEKLLGGLTIPSVTEPGSLIAMTGMQKLDTLRKDEGYVVDAVAGYLADARPDVTKDDIRHTLARDYLRNEAGVNVDLELDSYDMVLDLLYNLRQGVGDPTPMLPVSAEADGAEEASPETETVSPANEETDAVNEDETEIERAERLYHTCQYQEAYKKFCVLAASGAGDGRAMYYLGEYSAHGYPPEDINSTYARNWYRKGKEAGDALAALKAARSRKDKEAAFTAVLDLAQKGDVSAQFEAGNCCREGIGTSVNKEWAANWYSRAAEAGDLRAFCRLGNCYAAGFGVKKDLYEALGWYTKAANQGMEEAKIELKRINDPSDWRTNWEVNV